VTDPLAQICALPFFHIKAFYSRNFKYMRTFAEM
jgi:hypothetical protein